MPASEHMVRFREAEEACARLRAALARAGVVLPSLDVDVTSCVHEHYGPLLSLGGCNLATAEALTGALLASRERDA